MKRSKQWLSLITALLLCLGLLAGCQSGAKPASSNAAPPASQSEAPSQAASESKEGGYKVALVNYSIANSWRAQMQEEFIAEAERMKAEGIISEYFITNSNNDTA